MLEERDGWYVVNVREARWFSHPLFGMHCKFEREDRFPEMGIHLAVLEPGRPGCRYHRESAQEDFLVLSGQCLLLANGEERRLEAWDFVHCPPGTSHVFVGAGDGPCVILMMGRRPVEEIFYPRLPAARRHQAEAPEPTPDPQVAYSDVPPREPTDPPAWPPR